MTEKIRQLENALAELQETEFCLCREMDAIVIKKNDYLEHLHAMEQHINDILSKIQDLSREKEAIYSEKQAIEDELAREQALLQEYDIDPGDASKSCCCADDPFVSVFTPSTKINANEAILGRIRPIDPNGNAEILKGGKGKI